MTRQNTLSERCSLMSAEIGQEYGIDVPISLLQTILESILAKCLSNEDAAGVLRSLVSDSVLRRERRLERRVRLQVRREGYKGREADCMVDAIVETILDQAAALSHVEVEGILAEVRS